MAIFQPIALSWAGRELIIPAASVLGAIAEVEEVLTFGDLVQMTGVRKAPGSDTVEVGKPRPNMSKLAMAYGALLRYAGSAVSDDEVYAGIFGRGDASADCYTALSALLALMTPPTAIAKATPEGNSRGAKAAPSRSSKRSTRPPSARAG